MAILFDNITNAALTGHFDKTITSIRNQLVGARDNNEITVEEVGKILGGSISPALSQAVKFELEVEMTNKQIDKITSEITLTDKQIEKINEEIRILKNKT